MHVSFHLITMHVSSSHNYARIISSHLSYFIYHSVSFLYNIILHLIILHFIITHFIILSLITLLLMIHMQQNSESMIPPGQGFCSSIYHIKSTVAILWSLFDICKTSNHLVQQTTTTIRIL